MFPYWPGTQASSAVVEVKLRTSVRWSRLRGGLGVKGDQGSGAGGLGIMLGASAVLNCGIWSAIAWSRETSLLEAIGCGNGREEHPGWQPGRMRCTRHVSLVRASKVTAHSGVDEWTETGAVGRLRL